MKIDYRAVSRREFLLTSAGITVGVAFGVPFTAHEAKAQARSFSPNAWMTVGTDGFVTIISPSAEMGQSVMTAMPLLVAEEMDLDWNRVRVEQAPFNPSRYGNPMFGGGMLTGASRTTQGYYDVMRLAGMQARYIMMVAAARRWGVPALEVTTEPHKVVHKASNRSMDYGEIAAFAEPPAGVPDYKREHLKPKSQFRLIGKDLPRVDGRDKVMGKAVYGIDVRVPGMAYATLLRAPAQGEKPEKIDDVEAKKVPGVKAVVPLPYGVGVIAESYPAAIKGKAALKVTWSNAARSRAYDTDKLVGEYTQRARNMADAGVEYEKIGDPKTALSGAAARVSAEYVSVNVAQTPMEPMNCTALAEGDGIEVWAPMQAPSLAFLACTKGLGFNPARVKLNTMLLGGGFGRRVDADYVFDAGLLAKAMPGTPIKLIWSREDDIKHAKFRPLVVQHLTAGLDAKGNMVSLHHRIVSESIYARANPPLFAKAGGRDQPVCEGAFHLAYGIPHRQLDYLREQRGIDAGFWRGVGPGYTKFAIEALVGQIAAGAGRGPLEYRMALLAKQPRGQAVLQEVARMSEWTRKRPEGRALGIAYSDTWSAHIAEVAEVSVDRKTGRIRVHDVWCAVDCGVALQPKNVEAQIEGSVVFGLSCCLGEQVTIKGGEALQSNFHDYRILRMNETPRVHVKILEGGNAPSGIGEVGLPPIAPAVAGAVAALTGVRLRGLPFDQAALKA